METTEFLGGDLALNFVDTVGGLLSTGPLPEDELLRSYEDLVLFAVDQGLVTQALAQRLRRRARENPGEAEAALAAALERRALLDAVFRPLAAGERPDAAALDELGDLRGGGAGPRPAGPGRVGVPVDLGRRGRSADPAVAGRPTRRSSC